MIEGIGQPEQRGAWQGATYGQFHGMTGQIGLMIHFVDWAADLYFD